MPPKQQTITELDAEDKAILKAMVSEYRARKKNQKSKPIQLEELPSSPEIYIAKTTGIPALSRSGTGSGSSFTPEDGDEPGSAECEIYTLVDGLLEPVDTDSKTVYNLSRSAVGEGWILVARTKFGHWAVAGIFGSTTTTGTGSVSCTSIPGLIAGELAVSVSPSHVLGLEDGCIVLIEVGECS